MNFMSSFKAAWHIRKIQSLRDGENIAPTHLHLIISDFCNQNCNFCSYRMDGGFSTELFGGKNPKRFMPTEKAKGILSDFHRMGGKAVQFQGGGEPTVHPDHLKIFAHAQKLGLETGLVTNGIRLKDHGTFRSLDWIRISLDAGTEETYRKTRESKAWLKVLRNMALAGSWKTSAGTGFVVTRENHREIQEAASLTRAAGLSHMRVRGMLSEDPLYYNGLKIEIPDDTIIVNRFKEGLEPPDYEFCGYQQFTLYVGADLNVYTCCTNAYTKHGKIGDLSEQDFSQWLLSYDRRKWDSRSCRHCEFNEANRTINFLTDPNPKDVNFI